jgi:hypothetical protein
MAPGSGILYAGEFRNEFTGIAISIYQGFPSGPFGSGGPSADATAFSGDYVGFAEPGVLFVPDAYVSGAFLSNSSTYGNTTLASLGLTAGETVYTFGSGDTMTVKVVPEPTTSALMVLASIGLLVRRRRRSAEPQH